MPISTWPAAIHYEVGFNTALSSGVQPTYWTDISSRVLYAWRTNRGRQYELDANQAGKWTVPLANADGALDPSNTASPYYPNVVPYRPCRIRVQPGVNALTPDQATCGQGTPFAPGVVPARMGVVNDFGYALTLAASANAYTGSQVYQVVMPSTTTAFSTILLVPVVSVVPGQWYSFTAEVLITSGNSVATDVALLWYGAGGASLSSVGGTSQTITSGSSTWVTLTVSGQAPAGTAPAQYVALKVQPTANLSAVTTYQIGALQFEQSMTPTPWQAPQSVSRNLLPQLIATGTASMNQATDSVYNYAFVSGTGQGLAQGQYLTPAPSGQTVAFAWESAAGSTSSNLFYFGNAVSGSTGAQPDITQVTAGLSYAASWYSIRVASADATVAITPQITWFNASNQQVGAPTAGTAVTVPTGSWGRVTVAGTAPATAVWARISTYISTPATTTAANVIYITGAQLEQNTAATTWYDPGPTLHIFNGGVERWPQAWTLSGTYGQSGAVGVDSFAVLAQGILPSPFVAEVLAMNPSYFYQLTDPAGATAAADTAGKRPPMPVTSSPYGVGSLTFGTSVSSNSPTGGVQGTSGTCVAFANPASGPGVQKAESYLELDKTTATPGPPAAGSWTRMIAFQTSTIPGAGNEGNIWSAYPGTWNGNDQSSFWVQINQTGELDINVANFANNGLTWTASSSAYADGNWHQVIVTYGSSTLTYYVDGVQVSTGGGVPAGPSGIVADVIGCSVTTGTSWYAQGFTGDVAHVIEFPYALTAAQVANLYDSWRSASAGESSGARTQRVLDWVGYTGSTAIQTGSTTDMGPATDIGGSTAIDSSSLLVPGGVAFTGGTALQALQTVAQTENGNVYVSKGGALAFKGRADRYNKTVPTYVFGEQTQHGEWPYESVGFDFDPSHLYTGVQVTQYSTNQVAAARSSAAQALYGQRIQQVTMNQALYTETQDAANYLLGRYDTARMRVADITLHPSAVPGLWGVCLNLEIGTRIRVMRRPPGADPIQVDCFVESVAWTVDPAKGSAVVHVQCSPADLATYWQMAALHTTLNAQATSGTNTATINALPDAAVNSLNQSLPSGYQLTFEPGTPRAETLTIQPPLPATTIGYSTATLTFTSNFAFTHAAGSVACEPLPTGYTDPTTWDLSSILGAAYTTVVSGGGSGTNTVVVGALPDAKTNGLNSNWNTGDVVWLSPGTANFETATILSVSASVPGYTACTLTLTANLAHSHAAGGYVCDPLPPGTTNPATYPATTRIAY